MPLNQGKLVEEDNNNLSIQTANNLFINSIGDSMSGILDMNSNKVTNIGLCTNENDAANKKYVDKLLYLMENKLSIHSDRIYNLEVRLEKIQPKVEELSLIQIKTVTTEIRNIESNIVYPVLSFPTGKSIDNKKIFVLSYMLQENPSANYYNIENDKDKAIDWNILGYTNNVSLRYIGKLLLGKSVNIMIYYFEKS